MAVLKSSMEEHKLKKQSKKNKKNTLLLAQDLGYARNLAANDEKVRKNSLKYLKKYLVQRSKASPLTDESLQILWKGLFYSMWMSDKPLIQEECAENISDLIHCLQFNESMQFFKIGMLTLQNEWFGIDQLRLDKFLMFVRRLLRKALFVLKETNFKKQPNQVFAKVLQETILSTTKPVPPGLFMHFTEIYLEELAKVSDYKLQPSRTIDFLEPYISKLAFANDNRVIQWINTFIFTHLMKQHKLGLEYEDKYNVWKAQGFVGSINQIQKVIVPDAEGEEEDFENDNRNPSGYKPLDPRAGKVDVELPQILFNAKEISDALLLPKNDSRTTKKTRRHLTIWSEKFLNLHNGIYPMGVKKLESKKRKNLDNIDTNINRAAKKLIKFEQKLQAKEGKGTKRKREHSESQDDYHYCFERNSGVWFVTPEFNDRKEVVKQPRSENKKHEAKDLNKGESEILIPSKTFVKKLKKVKSDKEVEQVLSRLRGKSRASLSNLTPKQSADQKTPKKLPLNPGSPKKVVINTRLNISQEIDDHIMQVISSPQIPWDSSKKPGKPLLKTPIKASPINPFYKLRKY